MNIAICDDNRQVVDSISKYISTYLSQTDYQYEIFTFYSGETLLNANVDLDIVFLDVEMEGISGIGVSKELQNRNSQTQIVLVTAYSHYIDDALDLKLCRFVTKPVKKNRIISCLKRAIEIYESDDGKVELRYNNETLVLSPSEIVYIGIEDRKVYVHTYDKAIRSPKPLDYWLKKYSNKGFVQSHQSFLVNLRYIEAYSPTSIKLVYKGKQFNVHVSKRKYGTCKKIIEDYLRGREC